MPQKPLSETPALANAGAGVFQTPLLDAMRQVDPQRLRFHVPGHNGRFLAQRVLGDVPGLVAENFHHDWTELDELDALAHPSGAIQDAQRLMAETFGVAHSFFLVNGATAGILAAMLAALRPGDRVLLPRNVHAAVVHGLVLSGAEPVWLLPEAYPDWGVWGALDPANVDAALERCPDARMLIVTLPTYEGVGSDVRALTEICRRRNVLLLVDQAHGSLWPFSGDLPEPATACDCDIVVHSLHKGAGSLTQTAVAHLPEQSRVSPEAFGQALNLVQTTSPSYLLMASLDATRAYLASSAARDDLARMLSGVARVRTALDAIDRFDCFRPPGAIAWDPGKLLIRARGVSPLAWVDLLESARLAGCRPVACESVNHRAALFSAGLGLAASDYDDFIAAFACLARETLPEQPPEETLVAWALPVMAMTPREAYFAPGEQVPVSRAAGRIARQTVFSCPPGVPVLVPGEVIGEAALMSAACSPALPESVWVVRASAF